MPSSPSSCAALLWLISLPPPISLRRQDDHHGLPKVVLGFIRRNTVHELSLPPMSHSGYYSVFRNWNTSSALCLIGAKIAAGLRDAQPSRDSGLAIWATHCLAPHPEAPLRATSDLSPRRAGRGSDGPSPLHPHLNSSNSRKPGT